MTATVTSFPSAPAPTAPQGAEVMTQEETARETKLIQLGNGRAWDSDLVLREILVEQEKMVISASRIGRLLAWTREKLGHGQFTNWVSRHVPFSVRTAQRYIRVHDFFEAHPRLLKPMAGAGLKRTLLLTTLPDEQLELLAEEGQLGEVDIDELPSTPYVELQKRVNDLKKEKGDTDDKVAKLENQLAEAHAQIADLSGVMSKDDQKLIEKFRKWKDDAENQFALFSAQTEGIGARLKDHHPAVRAEYVAFWEWLFTRAEVSCLEAQVTAGKSVYGSTINEAITRARPLDGAGQPYDLETRFTSWEGGDIRRPVTADDDGGEAPITVDNQDGAGGSIRDLVNRRTGTTRLERFAEEVGAESVTIRVSGRRPAADDIDLDAVPSDAEEVARRRAAIRALNDDLPPELRS